MRPILVTLTLLLGLTLAAASGCSKKSGVETRRVESNFEAAPVEQRSEARKAVAAVKAGDYAGALGSLRKLAAEAKLTPAQKDALNDLILQLKQQARGAVNATIEGATKAADDVKKAAGDAARKATEGASKALGEPRKGAGK